ncbi:ATP-dependent RecD-like DNA helicase, partial [Candidatus Dependentiae bacterium]|nr:ATP-dependent RecD-like DNA helicase [Candidatus Dependentiae bacterium]
FAVKIFKTYGNQSINIISRNPYRLIDDVWGVGFKSADQIALKLGLEPHSPERVKAGFIHAINDATGIGHLYLDVESAKKQTLELLALDAQVDTTALLKQALTELYSDDKIKLISHNDQHYITLPHCYYAERGIAKKIKTLITTSPNNFEADLQKIYTQLRLPDARGVELNEDQQRGIMACFQNKITIITGGPGTGKTTLVKKLLELLSECHVSIRLAAPTGRAAKRMFEGTGRSTETIHRLLEFAPGNAGFLRNEYNALTLDYLIVDEASMIDAFLMHSLLKAMPQRGHLILLGDIDQLPSVGAGNVLQDLIDSGVCSVTRLTHIFRQAQDSLIIVNAHRVNRGEFPTTSLPNAKNDFIYIKNDEPEALMGTLHMLYKKRLPMLGIKAEDAVVLSPMNRGTAGNTRINQELQGILNPAKTSSIEIQRFGQLYRVNDRVMQIRNNYEKFVFNGDIGTITAIDENDQKVTISFGDRELNYEFTELNEITLAYAISIHKSQGSEFGAVIIPIFSQHFMLLQRNLIYTAITRAKRLCILVGQSKAIAMGIRNNKSLKRNTFLKEFLTTNLEAR